MINAQRHTLFGAGHGIERIVDIRTNKGAPDGT